MYYTLAVFFILSLIITHLHVTPIVHFYILHNIAVYEYSLYRTDNVEKVNYN